MTFCRTLMGDSRAFLTVSPSYPQIFQRTQSVFKPYQTSSTLITHRHFFLVVVVHGACSLPTLVALGGGGACRGRAGFLVARTTPCTRRLDPEPPEDLACRAATLRGESGRRGARQFGYSRLGVPVGRRRARSPHARQRAPHAPGGVRVDCRVGVVRVHRLGSLRHGAQSARGHRLCGTGRVGLFIDGLRLAGAVRCPRLRKPWGGELDSVVGDVRILHRERGVARGWPQQAAALPSGKLRGVLTGGSQLVATACPCRPCVFGGGWCWRRGLSRLGTRRRCGTGMPSAAMRPGRSRSTTARGASARYDRASDGMPSFRSGPSRASRVESTFPASGGWPCSGRAASGRIS